MADYVNLRSQLSVPMLRARVGAHPVAKATIIPGPPGPEGPEGPPGSPGAPGDGPSWWFGHGPPTTVLGSRPGDRYLDEDTGTVYMLGD